jgi:alanine racemase
MHNIVMKQKETRNSMRRGQRARRTIAEAKQHSQRSVVGWVNKIYYLELLRPGCICSRLYPLQFQGGLTTGSRPVVKTIAESLSQHDE